MRETARPSQWRSGMSIRWHRFVAPFLLAISLAAAPGCVATTAKPAYTVQEPPPAARSEQPRERVGMVWINGRWENVGNKWVWREGRLTREKPGHVWVQGRWKQHGNHYQWHPGHWERAGVTVRDHR